MIKFAIGASLALLLVGAPPAGPASVGEVTVVGDRATLIHGADREELSLSFADEFDTFSRFDGHKGFWRTTYWYDGEKSFGGRTKSWDGEEQLYVHAGDKGSGDAPLGVDPFPIRDGMLEITAARTTPEQAKALWNYRYTSGLISSIDAFSQTYGYFEMRARLPAGKGFWPAFWLCAQDRTCPPEIDIFETLGHDPSTVFYAVHIFDKSGEHKVLAANQTGTDSSKAFHTYGLAWSPKTIRYFFDRRQVAEFPTPESVHKPMYILANLAVGGWWPGAPDANTAFPSKMVVDYIRVYQFDGLPRQAPGVVRPQAFESVPAAPE